MNEKLFALQFMLQMFYSLFLECVLFTSIKATRVSRYFILLHLEYLKVASWRITLTCVSYDKSTVQHLHTNKDVKLKVNKK